MSSGDESSLDPTATALANLMDGPDDNTLRIMMSTDNHLGYNERDPVRGLDSFAAFEEVLYLSKRYQCDMVLIAGDLFHDNRPSRRTLHKTMEILKAYTFGPNPVKIQILSDPTTTLSRSQTTVNYLSEFHSVDLPIFSIHGNHDDPTRDAGDELLAALDLLSVSSLVNYFGRQDAVDRVEVKPLLLQKGNTQVALYGMGSMRDERLSRMFLQKKVKFLRPQEDEEDDDDDDDKEFINIFALHQNRDLGRGTKNCVQESMIPDWFDIVVWGHEHECNIEFMESVVGTFRITQPGSSVATSLVAGEAVRKKIGVLDIQGKGFRLHPVPLTQVRSFVTTELSLKESKEELDADDPKIDEKVTELLEDQVRVMILNARDKMKEIHEQATALGNNAGEEDSPLKYKLVNPEEVLVRIRVEHSGFTTLNAQRFGSKFVGTVSNPSEMLLFHRKKEPTHAKASKKRGLKKPMAPDEFDDNDDGKARLEHLVQDYIDGAEERKLHLLLPEKLRDAMVEYVEKGGVQSIVETAESGLEYKQELLISGFGKTEDGGTVSKGSEVRDFFDNESQLRQEETQNARSASIKRKNRSKSSSSEVDDEEADISAAGGKENQMDLDDDDDDEDERVRAASQRKRSSKMARSAPKDPKRMAARRNRLDDMDDDDDDLMDEEEEISKPKSKSKSAGRPKRSNKRSVNYSLDEDDEDDDSDAVVVLDHDDDDDDEVLVVDEPVKKKKKASSKKSALSSRATSTYGRKKSTSSSSRKASRSKASRLGNSDEDDSDDLGFGTGTADIQDDWGSAPTRSQI